MTPLRLVYVLHIFPKLSETFVAGELAELRRRGVELRILSLLPPREVLQHEIIRRAGLTELTTYDVSKFADVIREFKPHLLHAHFATEATAKARELSKLTGVPYTFTAHGYDIHRKPPADFRDRALLARAVVTVSDANADYIAHQFQVPRDHLRVIPCGVNTDEFAPAALPIAVAHNPALWLVCVARHVAVKNLGLLLDACAELRRRGVEFRCAMIGDGPLGDELLAKRDELKLQSLVTLPGALDQAEVLKWWQRAAVGVLSSQNEGMPVCLMEAAACGVPVVAPSVGGIPELVQDGVTGLLTKANDLNSLATALQRLLCDSDLRIRLGQAARRRAEQSFSVHQHVIKLMELWAAIDGNSCLSRPHSDERGNAVISPESLMFKEPSQRVIPVSDPFNAAIDVELPTVVAAIDPALAAAELKRHLPRVSGEGRLKLKAIRVVRHKPGKRCVVEYDLKTKRPGQVDEEVTIIGKIRSRRSGNEGFRQQEMVWNAGFAADSADGISVPEPVGVISEFKMWCQRKVAGHVSTDLLTGGNGVGVARRIADAIHKLHRANLPTDKTHTMADELRILRECFNKLSAQKPEWIGRLAKLRVGCEEHGLSLPARPVCGIHRDFYSSQVIVDGSRLWLIDFDCFCLGDPGLDIGNFIGHVTEQALREMGNADALRDVELAMEDRFVELSGEQVRPSVRVYSTLTLARHVYLSAQFPERRHTTERLMELCEQRLGLHSVSP